MVIKKYIVLFGVLLVMHLTSAQSISGIQLTKKQPILNGKAFFSFPDSAVEVHRQTDLMAAPPNTNEETRIVCNVGKVKLVFFAQELYLLSNKNVFTELSADSAYTSNFSSKVFSDKDSLYSIISTPLKYDSAQGGLLIKSLLVQTQDNTLFRIDVYLTSNGFANRTEFQQLAENVFSTLAKGNRIDNRNERDEKYEIGDGKKSFIFHLPENYCITKDVGADFDVFRFHKFRNFTDNTWANLVIYAGPHPSYTFMEYGLDERSAQKDTGMFLGKKTQWLFFNYDLQGLFLKEQMLPRDDIEKGEMIHAAMITNNQESLKELTQIAESAKLELK
jgi:hypothetical protein